MLIVIKIVWHGAKSTSNNVTCGNGHDKLVAEAMLLILRKVFRALQYVEVQVHSI